MTALFEALIAELRDDADARSELIEALAPDLANALRRRDRSAGSDAHNSRLLTAAEKADQLGLHPDTVARMAREGRIWSRKYGREWRFRPDHSEIKPLSSNHGPVDLSMPRPRRSPREYAAVASIRGH